MICWKCKKEIEVSQISRSTECPLCHADLHTCKGCRHYSSGSHYDCKEAVDELISDKEKGNFCDFFQVNANLSAFTESSSTKADDAKKAFAALFGD